MNLNSPQNLHSFVSLPVQPVCRLVVGNHLQRTIPAVAIPSPGKDPRLRSAGSASPGARGGFLSAERKREGEAGGGKVWEEGYIRSVYRGSCKHAREILGPSQSRKV